MNDQRLPLHHLQSTLCRHWLIGLLFLGGILVALLGPSPAARAETGGNATLPPVLTLRTTGSGAVTANPPTSQVYVPGQQVTLTAQPSYGWAFTGWSDDLSGTVNPTVLVMAGDRTVTANFAQQPPSTIASDDFNQCALNQGRWTFVDPLEDATLLATGEGIQITVPGGGSHDIWTTGIHAPHLLQVANDVDFTIASKFESVVKQRIQMQGLLVIDDDENLVRVNVQFDGTNTRLLAATFTNGTPTVRANEIITGGVPIHLRLRRASDSWTVSYSYNGSDWLSAPTLTFSHALSVKQVGVFVGNAGSNPAYSGLIDYFFNSATPIAPEDPIHNTVPVQIVGEGNVARTCGSPLTLTAQPALGWNFAGWSGSVSGNNNPVSLTIAGSQVVTATFTPKPYTLTLHAVGGGRFTTTPNQRYFDLGDQVRVTAVADPGWIFTGWSGAVTSPDLAVTLTMTGNLALSANFVVFNDNSGFISDDFNACELRNQWTYTDPLGDATLYLSGTELHLTVPKGSEHNIWTTGSFAPRLMQPISGTNFALEAKFTSLLEKRFQLQGLLIEADASNFLRINFQHDGTNVRLLAISFANGNPNVRVDQIIDHNAPLYLRVVRSGTSWSLLYSTDGVNWVTGNEFAFTLNLAATAVGLFAGNAGGNPAHTAVVDYFFATAAPIEPEDEARISIQGATIGNGTISRTPEQPSYACSQAVEVRAVPEPGWNFTGWSGDLSGTTNPVTLTPTTAKAITATFTQASYQLQVTSEGFGQVTVSPQKSSYRYGEQVVLTAVTGAGWQLQQWSGDLTGATTPITITMDQNKVIKATFARTEYSLAVTQEGQGTVTVSPNKNRYNEGETVLLQATPATGWLFAGWSGSLSSHSASASLFMDSDKSVTAHFKQPVTLSTAVQGKGKLTTVPVGPPYYRGDTIQLVATPDAGWHFTGWSGALSGSTNPASLLLDGNKAVIANFAENTLALTLQVQDPNGRALGGTVTANPPGLYSEGQLVTLTATPATGYAFVTWVVTSGATPSTVDLTQPEITIPVAGPATYVARFRLLSGGGQLFIPLVMR